MRDGFGSACEEKTFGRLIVGSAHHAQKRSMAPKAPMLPPPELRLGLFAEKVPELPQRGSLLLLLPVQHFDDIGLDSSDGTLHKACEFIECGVAQLWLRLEKVAEATVEEGWLGHKLELSGLLWEAHAKILPRIVTEKVGCGRGLEAHMQRCNAVSHIRVQNTYCRNPCGVVRVAHPRLAMFM